MCKQNTQKYLLLKLWGSLCPGHFSPLRKIHLQFRAHISQEAEQEAHGVIVLPSASRASALVQDAAPRQPAWAASSWLSLAQRGKVMGLHCSQGKRHLQGCKVLQARCSRASLHLGPTPTACSNAPTCPPYAEDMNASPFAWPCTMLFLPL